MWPHLQHFFLQDLSVKSPLAWTMDSARKTQVGTQPPVYVKLALLVIYPFLWISEICHTRTTQCCQTKRIYATWWIFAMATHGVLQIGVFFQCNLCAKLDSWDFFARELVFSTRIRLCGCAILYRTFEFLCRTVKMNRGRLPIFYLWKRHIL